MEGGVSLTAKDPMNSCYKLYSKCYQAMSYFANNLFAFNLILLEYSEWETAKNLVVSR